MGICLSSIFITLYISFYSPFVGTVGAVVKKAAYFSEDTGTLDFTILPNSVTSGTDVNGIVVVFGSSVSSFVFPSIEGLLKVVL